MSPHEKLVPITREVLRAFYAKNPLQPVPKNEAASLVQLLYEGKAEVSHVACVPPPCNYSDATMPATSIVHKIRTIHIQ